MTEKKSNPREVPNETTLLEGMNIAQEYFGNVPINTLKDPTPMEERYEEYKETLLPLAKKAYHFYTALKGIIEDHEAALSKLRGLEQERKEKKYGD